MDKEPITADFVLDTLTESCVVYLMRLMKELGQEVNNDQARNILGAIGKKLIMDANK